VNDRRNKEGGRVISNSLIPGRFLTDDEKRQIRSVIKSTAITNGQGFNLAPVVEVGIRIGREDVYCKGHLTRGCYNFYPREQLVLFLNGNGDRPALPPSLRTIGGTLPLLSRNIVSIKVL
jgi:hypothetical protein